MEYTSKEVYEYVSKKSNDPIVEWKKCRLSGQEFPIYKSDLEFYDKVSPTFEMCEADAKSFFEKNNDVKDHFEYKDGKLKAKIPTPTLCPEERERRRFAFMNDKNLYMRKCDCSGKLIISNLSSDKSYKVYDYLIRESRDWSLSNTNPRYKNFYLDFENVLFSTPISSKSSVNIENSDYCNSVVDTKNSYMCFYGLGLEDCLYVYNGMSFNNNCVDCDYINQSSYCFDSVQLNNCSGLFHCGDCINCHNSSYLQECIGCHDCFNCKNLYNKSYCIDNKQYSKEEYEHYIINVKHRELKTVLKVVGCEQTESENSYGNNLTGCKNCGFSLGLINCDNVKYSRDIPDMNSVYDGRGIKSSYCLETFGSGYSYHCICVNVVLHSNNVLYSFWCDNCKDCFGCVGLKNKNYYIYNQEHTREDYNKIVPQIIVQMIRDKEWGEFFNPQLSYFGYNETISMDYYPLIKEEALKRGYKRSDYESPKPHVEKIVEGSKLPHQGCKIIQEKKPEILEKIVNYAVICEVSKKPFRITKQEIDFYIKHNLPLPTKHPNVRHQERLTRKDPTIMHLIHCDECGEEMLSVHLPGEGKKILCEKCFNKEI